MGRAKKSNLEPAVAAQLLVDLVLKKAFTEADDLLQQGIKLDYVVRTPAAAADEPPKQRTVFHRAVEAGHLEAIEWLASKGTNPNTPMERGTTVLHLCVATDKPAVLARLCQLAAASAFRFTLDVSRRNAAGETPTEAAIKLGRVELARMLLQAGADHDFNARGFVLAETRPPLAVNQMQHACATGDLELLDTLYELGEVPVQRTAAGDTLLHVAVRVQQWGAVEWLLEKGVTPAARDGAGRTVLQATVAEGRGADAVAEVLQRVGAAGADAGALRLAVEGQDEAVAAALLDAGASPAAAADGDGNTAVHVAAMLPSRAVLARLAAGDDKRPSEVGANAVNARGDTALHLACRAGLAANAAFLLGLPSANQNLRNARGSSPLHLAAARGALGCAQALLDHCRERADEPAAAAKKPPPKGKKDAAPADEARPTEVEAEDSEGNTALQVAMEYNQADVVKLLIGHGASVSRTSRLHGTLLHQAVCGRALDVARALLSGGACVHERDRNDQTPLHIAVLTGSVEATIALLEAGASVACQDEVLGRTPLHEAAARGLEDVVPVLLRHGARVDVRDHRSMTPLHHATVCGSAASVQLLLDARADPNALDVRNRTPLHCACESRHAEACVLLLRRRADLTLKDVDGWAPIHVAAAVGSTECARHLIAAGAVLNEADAHDSTPLALASESRNVEVARLLVSSWRANRRQAVPAV